ncbi:MAG: hypothetical protein BWY59_01171 [Verrucomicrobia bacterium ADurb.Bin345]|nr:MAG: hypothetical protein BWY59_01171 [Verrucomicrobia bacterium ADurb.Bin345]
MQHFHSIRHKRHLHGARGNRFKDAALLKRANGAAREHRAGKRKGQRRAAVGLGRVVRVILHLPQGRAVRAGAVVREAQVRVRPEHGQRRLDAEIRADHRAKRVVTPLPRIRVGIAVEIAVRLHIAGGVEEYSGLRRAVVLHDHRGRALVIIHKQRPVARPLDARDAAGGVSAGGRDRVHLVADPAVPGRGVRQFRALRNADDFAVLVIPLDLHPCFFAVAQRVARVAAQVRAVRVAAVRHHGEVVVHARVAPHLHHVVAVERPAPPAAHMHVAPRAFPARDRCVAVLEPLVAQGIHGRPDRTVGNLDFIAVFPHFRPVVISVDRRVGVEVHDRHLPEPGDELAAALRHLVAAGVARINPEQLLQLGHRFGTRPPVEVLQAGQVRRGHHVDAGGDDALEQEVEHAVRVARNAVFHAHVPREDHHLVVGVSARRQLVQVHEIRLEAHALQRAGDLLHLALVAVVLRVVRGGPEERDVRFRVRGAGKQLVDLDLLHQVERVAGNPVRGFDHAVGVHDAETLFAVRDVWTVLPREDVRADRIRLQAFPQRVADQRPLPELVHPGPHRLGAGEAGFRVQHRDARDLLRVGHAPVSVLRLVAQHRPRVVVHAEEIDRRAARGRRRGDLAAVLGVVAPVFLAPLHAHRGVGNQVVRVCALRRRRAQGREIGHRVFAELHHVRPDRAVRAVCAVLFDKRHLGEVGERRAPRRVRRRNRPVFRLAPVAERLLRFGVIAVQQAAPEAEIAVLVADDPAGDRLRVLVAAAHGANPFRVLRARLRMFVVDDVGLPPVRVRDALGIDFRRMHRVPLVREPVRRPLVTDQREDAQAALLARLDEVIVVLPLEVVVGILLDVLPDDVNAHRVRAHLHHLVEIVVNLLKRLPDAERTIPRLVRDPVRHPRLARCGIEEIAVLHRDERLHSPECRRHGEKNEPEQENPRGKTLHDQPLSSHGPDKRPRTQNTGQPNVTS